MCSRARPHPRDTLPLVRPQLPRRRVDVTHMGWLGSEHGGDQVLAGPDASRGPGTTAPRPRPRSHLAPEQHRGKDTLSPPLGHGEGRVTLAGRTGLSDKHGNIKMHVI